MSHTYSVMSAVTVRVHRPEVRTRHIPSLDLHKVKLVSCGLCHYVSAELLVSCVRPLVVHDLLLPLHSPQFSFLSLLPASGMLASQLASRVHSDEIAKFSIVRVDKHVCNTIQDRK